MRKILLLILLAAHFSGSAQESSEDVQRPVPAGLLSFQYNDVMSGRALTLTYHQPFGDRGWRGYLGLRYHLHKPKSDVANQGIYVKAFYARTGLEHFGVKAGLEKGCAVFKKYPTELFGFWDAQISHGALQSNPYQVYDSVNRYILTTSASPQGPVTFWENNFGLGLRSQVTDRFGYRIFGGGGVAFINDNAWVAINAGPLGAWTGELFYTFGFGVEYKL